MKCIVLLISSPIDRFLTFCHFLVTSPYSQNCCSITSPNDFSSIRTPHEIDYILFYHLTKRLFINSYTSRNQLYYSTTSPNDFSSIRTPHEINCILFYHLTKRFFINSYSSRNHLYTILPPHQTIFINSYTSRNPTTLSRHHEESTAEYHYN